MSASEENWQMTRPAISSRTGFLFNNELLSDVKFVVLKYNERRNKRCRMEIPAHKFILSISSPVFFKMFHGEMADTSDSIDLPDCEHEGLLEMLRYMYTDTANLSVDNVMQVMYLSGDAHARRPLHKMDGVFFLSGDAHARRPLHKMDGVF